MSKGALAGGGAGGSIDAGVTGGGGGGSGDLIKKLLPFLSLLGGKGNQQQPQQPQLALPPDLRGVSGGNTIPLPAPEAAVQPERALEPLPVLAQLLEQRFI